MAAGKRYNTHTRLVLRRSRIDQLMTFPVSLTTDPFSEPGHTPPVVPPGVSVVRAVAIFSPSHRPRVTAVWHVCCWHVVVVTGDEASGLISLRRTMPPRQESVSAISRLLSYRRSSPPPPSPRPPSHRLTTRNVCSFSKTTF